MVGQYFSTTPDATSRPSTVRLELPDVSLDLAVDRGVFSASRIDAGTLVLLRALPPLPSGPILDLGCGYGPIACTLARRDPTAQVWAVDVNERALELTRANAAGLHVQVVTPEQVPAQQRFAAIVSNPPIRVGKQVLHDMCSTWLPRLEPDASAWLVVQRHLGADSLAAWLATQGWVVVRRASKQAYRVLEVHR